jgi:hypothetical protein
MLCVHVFQNITELGGNCGGGAYLLFQKSLKNTYTHLKQPQPHHAIQFSLNASIRNPIKACSAALVSCQSTILLSSDRPPNQSRLRSRNIQQPVRYLNSDFFITARGSRWAHLGL